MAEGPAGFSGGAEVPAAEMVPEKFESVVASPLEWGASVLVDDYCLRTGRYNPRGDGEHSLHRTNALLRVQAAAAAVNQFQRSSFEKVCDWLLRMVEAGQMKAVAFLDHVLYDETSMRVRLRRGQETEAQTTRLFVSEQRWAMLLQTRPLPSAGGGQPKFVVLQAHRSPSVRGAGNAVGETILKVLQSSCQQIPPRVARCFDQVIRLNEVDECPANFRAEKMVMDAWAADSVPCLRLESVCLLHKCHAAAQKTWPLHDKTITGLIHAALVLSDAGQLGRFKASLDTLVQQQLRILRVPCLDPAASIFKEKILNLFTPPSTQVRRKAVVQLMAEFFNADWRQPVLQHVCSGLTCCRNREHSVLKAQMHLRKMTSVLRPQVFNRRNWLHWSLPLSWFGLGAAIHQVFTTAFQRAFQQGPNLPLEQTADPALNVPDNVFGGLSTGAAAHDAEDKFERYRQENALSLKTGVEFMQHQVLHDVFLLRATLDPEVKLMKSLTAKLSRAWEQDQLKTVLDHGTRDFRLLRLYQGLDTKTFFEDSNTVFEHRNYWDDQEQTEHFRSVLFISVYRPAAVIWQLIHRRTRLCPYKIFGLLARDTDDQLDMLARELLEGTPLCLQDSWTAGFLAKYNTVAKLRGEEAKHVLWMLGTAAFAATFSTERLHSSNLRRARSRLTHAADISHLALSHMGFAGPPWLEPQMPQSAQSTRKRGRPKKKVQEEEGRAKVKRTGGGGAWRAFCHVSLGGQKFTATALKDVSRRYRALTAEQKQEYEQLGRAGRLSECISLSKLLSARRPKKTRGLQLPFNNTV